MDYRILININIVGKVAKKCLMIEFHDQLCGLALLDDNILIKILLFICVVEPTVVGKQLMLRPIRNTSFGF